MLISEINFFSFLSYTPKVHAVEWMQSLKYDKRYTDREGHVWDTSEYLVHRLNAFVPAEQLNFVFPKGSILVPMPKSALPVSGGLWVPDRIAKALVRIGFGSRVSCVLARRYSIRKSATSLKGERPTAQELYDSLSVSQRELGDFDRVVLVDDLITRGANSIGAASRLREAFPTSEISCFAIMRTISNASEFKSVVAPVSGTVTLKNGQTFRRP
jgi:hypothetical protein